MKLSKIILITFLITVSSNSWGYDPIVHYYSTAYVMDYIEASDSKYSLNIDGESKKDALRLIAFCSQLPDETLEYDALYQYRKFFENSSWTDYLKWAFTDNDKTKDILRKSRLAREMVTVQQLLHGLTGGSSEKLTKIALDLITSLIVSYNKKDSIKKVSIEQNVQILDSLCSIGFAIHLLGDSIAHRNLNQEPDTVSDPIMYTTGSGHALHGTRPDEILNSLLGLNGWDIYNKNVAHTIAGNDAILDKQYYKFIEELKKISGNIFFPNDAAEELILQEAKSWTKQNIIKPEDHPNESCQSYMDSVFKNESFSEITKHYGENKINCACVWKIYMEAAVPRFDNSKLQQSPKLTKTDYVSPESLPENSSCEVKIVDAMVSKIVN